MRQKNACTKESKNSNHRTHPLRPPIISADVGSIRVVGFRMIASRRKMISRLRSRAVVRPVAGCGPCSPEGVNHHHINLVSHNRVPIPANLLALADEVIE